MIDGKASLTGPVRTPKEYHHPTVLPYIHLQRSPVAWSNFCKEAAVEADPGRTCVGIGGASSCSQIRRPRLAEAF